MPPPKIHTLHVLNLDVIGGVERSFAAFIQDPHVHAHQHHHVLVGGKPAHPLIREVLYRHAASVSYQRYWRGIKIPRVPALLRRHHLQCTLHTVRPRRIVLWNSFARLELAQQCAEVAEEVIYFERGACWQHQTDARTQAFLSMLSGIVCNSRAAARTLALRFGWKGPTIVCLNALRAEATPPTPQSKIFPDKRPLRLGVAGRIIPLKGHPVALHTALVLLERNYAVELHIAGDGPERKSMERLARQLGIEARVTFWGVVGDMPTFYRDIDVLLIPSLREPFGLVSIEAAAWGCPVIASAVDGLPETMRPGESGLSLPCTEAIEGYRHYGGSLGGMPDLVYDPMKEEMVPPAFIHPRALADAVGTLYDEPERFEHMSRHASIHTLEHFSFAPYVGKLLNAFDTLGPRQERTA